MVHQRFGEELAAGAGSAEVTELSLLRDMTPRFELVTPRGSIDLLGELPAAPREVRPVLERRLDFDGPALVAMEHDILYTEFGRDEFFEYLDHEGLERKDFEAHMGSDEIQTEGYQRSLKTLVRVGSAGDAASDLHRRPLGQSIEILLLDDPYRLAPGDPLAVRVLLHGEPLAGQLVHAHCVSPDGASLRLRARTDAEGKASFGLERAGVWLIRLTHLAPCSQRSGVECEDTLWESYWSSFSFELD